MIFVGVDLSGPANYKETGIAWFEKKDTQLRYLNSLVGADDRVIFDLVSNISRTQETVIGLDAPLSYNIGGGDRDRDAQLRRLIIGAGLSPGSVMAPTMTKMSYLTLRGISVARFLENIEPRAPRIVEVHPGASLALRGASVRDIRRAREDGLARLNILKFLEGQGLNGVGNVGITSPHLISACAGALSAWAWVSGNVVWTAHAEPPYHPYDFVC
jgi:predicted nuclease with RNAse H fold